MVEFEKIRSFRPSILRYQGLDEETSYIYLVYDPAVH